MHADNGEDQNGSVSASNAHQPLAGTVVVELGSVVMVPYAAQMLADLGARVIRVEGAKLDSGRVIGGVLTPDFSGVSLNLHRNKESVRLDLKNPDGLEIAVKLIRQADVFVTNMRRGALERLGLGYRHLKSLNESLIYCNANGFASDSESRDRPAFDDIIQAETGLPALVGLVSGKPQFFPCVVADKLSGLFVAQAILGALVRKSNTGLGCEVEVPMFDSVLGFNLVEHLAEASLGGSNFGYSRILSVHRGPHKTLDGYIAIMPYSDRDWEALYNFVGRQDELESEYFKSHKLRVENPDIVYKSLSEIMALRTTEEWLTLGKSIGIPVAPVPNLGQIINDPDLHRGVIGEAYHPQVGTYRHIESPFRFDGVRPGLRRTTPRVGEHGSSLLHELGYSLEEIQHLHVDGAVVSPIDE